MADISVEEFARWREERTDFALLDIREPWELEISSLAGARNVPVASIAADTNVIPKDRDVVLICRSGSRTERVAAALEAQGFSNVYSLEGGLNEWSRRIDPTIRQY